MAQARRQATRSQGPAGWVVLLGLMVLALVIAATNKGCADDEISPAAQSPTSTATSTVAAEATAQQAIIDQISAQLSQSPITFVTGKTDLAPTSRVTLDRVAAILSANPTLNPEIRGYTDDEGDAAKNEQLSKDRAQAVVDYLVGKGIAATRLIAVGLGEANPLVENTTPANRAKNRRIEFALR